MTSGDRPQKFRADDARYLDLKSAFDCLEICFTQSDALGSDASSVWNFYGCAQTSFPGETIGGDSKCDCFLRLSCSQIAANVSRIFKKFHKSEPDRPSMNILVDFFVM